MKTLPAWLQIREKSFWLAFLLLSAAYFLTYIQADTILNTRLFHDDALYFKLGQSIAEGKWLGAYDQMTLAKAPSYALFLALSMVSGLPYLWLVAGCHIIAVSFLLRNSMYLFEQTKLLALLLGALLLFNPIFARKLIIYRFQLPALGFMVFLGTLIALFHPASRRGHGLARAADACTVSIAWGLLWFSREESLLYLVCAAAALTAFAAVSRSLAHPLRNLQPLLWGCCGVISFWLFICGMNKMYYGRFIVCERTASPYTQAVKTFHSIADPDFPAHVAGTSASTAKMLQVAAAAPLSRPLMRNLAPLAIGWGGYFLDRQVLGYFPVPAGMPSVSHFEWAWLNAADACGYYKDASTLAAFYTAFDRELKKAVQEGRLALRQDMLLQAGPYFLLKKDVGIVLKVMRDHYVYLLPTPAGFAQEHQNILTRSSPELLGRLRARNLWRKMLKITYIAGWNTKLREERRDSCVNAFWNAVAALYAYTGVPLMHAATPAALIAFLLSLARRRWTDAAALAVACTTYTAHYALLAAVSVVSGYHAVNPNYFLPSYTPLLFAAVLALAVLLGRGSREGESSPFSPAAE